MIFILEWIFKTSYQKCRHVWVCPSFLAAIWKIKIIIWYLNWDARFTKINIFGMAVMPFSFYRNYHTLAVYLPILYLSFYQNTNLHLFKWARLSSSLFTFFTTILLIWYGTNWVNIFFWIITGQCQVLEPKAPPANNTIVKHW